MNRGNSTPSRLTISCLGLTAMLFTGSLMATTETYYKWKDESGTWSYGVIPPHGVEAIKVETRVGVAKPQAAETASGNAATDSTDSNANSEATEYLVEERNKPSKAEQKRLCEAARSNLETLQSSAVVRLRSEDGSVKALSEEERQREIDNAKKTIEDFC